MNPYVPDTESFLEQQFSVDEFPPALNSCRVLVAGYSLQSESCPLETQAEQATSPRAAILFADSVVESPETEIEAGETRLGLLKGRKIFRGLVAGFGGKFACYTGNFIIAEFQSVDTALQCAVNLQIALGNQNARSQHRHQIRYRLGIEVCKTASAKGTQFHRTIDLVSELERGEHSGGIYISQLARVQLGKKSIARFVPLGKRYSQDASEAREAFWIEMDRSMIFDVSRAGSEGASTFSP